MTIGLTKTKAQLDSDFGAAALDLRDVLTRLQALHHFCLITPDAFFTGLGYTPTETATIKSGMSDGDMIRQAWEGAIALAQQDWRLNLDQLASDLVRS